MAITGQIDVLLRARDELSGALDKVRGDLGKLEGAGKKASGGLGAAFKKLGPYVATAAAAVGTAAAGAAAWMLKLGSDAAETANVTKLAFGDLQGAAEQWAREYSDATGSSRDETIQFASDLGLLVSGMGFGNEAALTMSQRMVELAGDMASAKNIRLEEALEKIRAGLVGEAEPLRTMGVLLSAARVKEEAYASGIAERGKELTETQKVEARMNIILADSVAMHGDLINTQDSSANLMRRFRNEVKDAASSIGTSLQPVMAAALKVLTNMTGGLKAGAERVGKFIAAWLENGGMERLTEVAKGFWERLKTVFSVVKEILTPVGSLAKFILKLQSGIIKLIVWLGKWAYGFKPVKRQIDLVIGVVKIAWDWLKKLTGWLSKLIPDSVLPSLDGLRAGIEDVSTQAEFVGPIMREVKDETKDAGDESEEAEGKVRNLSDAIDYLGGKSLSNLNTALKSMTMPGGGLTALTTGMATAARTADTETRKIEIEFDTMRGKVVDSARAAGAGIWLQLTDAGREGLPKVEQLGTDLGEATGTKVRDGFSDVINVDNITNLLMSAFTGGGGLMGFIKAFGAQIGGELAKTIGGGLMGKLSGALGGALGGIPGLGGLFGGAAASAGGAAAGGAAGGGAAAGAAGGGIMGGLGKAGAFLATNPIGWAIGGGVAAGFLGKKFGLFGASAKEKKSREVYRSIPDELNETIRASEEFRSEFRDMLEQGASEEYATVRASVVAVGELRGKTWQESVDLYERIHGEMAEQDLKGIEKAKETFDRWLALAKLNAEDRKKEDEDVKEAALTNSAERLADEKKKLAQIENWNSATAERIKAMWKPIHVPIRFSVDEPSLAAAKSAAGPAAAAPRPRQGLSPTRVAALAAEYMPDQFALHGYGI